MLEEIGLRNVGPAERLTLRLAPRLNILTGDNGLGKTVLLDVTWWALTGTWPSQPPHPRDRSQTSEISVVAGAIPFGSGKAGFSTHSQQWTSESLPRAPRFRTLCAYARSDGSLSLWDFARNSVQNPPQRIPAYHFTQSELWNGLRDGDQSLSEGLERDLVNWQARRDSPFLAMQEVLEELSAPGESLSLGRPQRVFIQDGRDRPTLLWNGEEIPLVFASAGMKRIIGLAYGLVWAWHEQIEVAKLLQVEPVDHLTVLFDEPEGHLHPKWQRSILPSLLEAVRTLGASSVQIVAATHSPLVLASLEPHFNPEEDKLILLQPTEGGADLVEEVWSPGGTACSWLVSDVFGLKQARSREAEEAIEAAEAFMRGEPTGNPALSNKDQIHAALLKALPDLDHFWPRWLVTQNLLDRES